MYDIDWARLVVLELIKSDTRVGLFLETAWKAYIAHDKHLQEEFFSQPWAFPKGLVIENLAVMLSESHRDIQARNLWNYMKTLYKGDELLWDSRALESLFPWLFKGCL